MVDYDIIKAKQGDETELAKIITNLMPIIYHYAKSFTAKGLDCDDLVQEGIIGLFTAIEKYDSNNTASFKTFSVVCIRNAMVSAVRSATRKKHSPLNSSVPIDENQMVDGPEQITIEKESYKIAVKKINKKLSKFEKNVLTLFLDNYKYKQIAIKLDCTEKAVDNALYRIRQKLKQ